jgi:hypothetical protein
MKRSRNSEEQILFALKQGGRGTAGGGRLPADGDQRGDVLRLEEALRQPGASRSASSGSCGTRTPD